MTANIVFACVHFFVNNEQLIDIWKFFRGDLLSSNWYSIGIFVQLMIGKLRLSLERTMVSIFELSD